MTRRLVGLGMTLALVAATGGATATAFAQTTPSACSVPTVLPSPPPNRPLEVLTVHVARGLRAANGTLAVTFTPSVATDHLVFRLWPNSPVYAKHGAALTVARVREAGHAV